VVALSPPPPPPLATGPALPPPETPPAPSTPQARNAGDGTPQAQNASDGTQARSASDGIQKDAHQHPSMGPPANGSMMTGSSDLDPIVEAKSRSLLDITGRPTYLLTLDQAAELAMFNSREYQDQRENLYIQALPVTLQRFTFMAQFFAAEQAIRSYTGRDTPAGQTNRWSLNGGTRFS